jgi:aminopeptidase
MGQINTVGSSPYVDAVTNGKIQWSAVRSPTQAWADMVLPELPEEERLLALWELVFRLSRADGNDPVADWNEHLASLSKRKDYLSEKKFAALKYSAPGTDLTVGLPAGHKWESGSDQTKIGTSFTANIPTEEVYTMPDRLQVDGVVRSTKPLDYGGMLIENFSLRFEKGEVVHADAELGQQYLKNALEVDKNARFTGEVALVPNSSPISQSGVIFYDGLYDENASNHIALGSSYKSSMRAGEDMSDADFTAAGGNISNLHLDFMIGSAEMDVDGTTQDGNSEPIMRSGEWTHDL